MKTASKLSAANPKIVKSGRRGIWTHPGVIHKQVLDLIAEVPEPGLEYTGLAKLQECGS